MSQHANPSARDVLQRMKDDGVRFVDLKFLDLFGALQHITLTAENLDENSFLRGLNFDGSSVRGFQDIHESDLILRPDPASAFLDPFFDEPTLSLFGDVIDPRGTQLYPRDPRGVARRAEQLLQGLGIATTASFGLEIEFYVFDDVRFDQATQHAFYFVNSEGAFWNSGQSDRPNLGHRAARKSAYFAAPPIDTEYNLRSKIVDLLRGVGMTPELHHHEVGAAGQNEIGYRFAPLREAGDNAVKFKYIVKNAAHRYGRTATFMPKPLFEEAGSGMHTNVSLWKDGRNLFYESGGYADLSQMAIHFIGGVLRHAPALCAICSPSTNSYRRLVPGFEAPVNLVHSQRNRSACVRIPFTGANPKAKRIEFRTPDPTANPYLSNAAVVMAGIDGILGEIEPPDPVDQDIYQFAMSEHGKHLQNVPESLAVALDALEDDHEFLLRGDVFPIDLIDTWLRWKREKELKHINLRPHPSEFTLYFDA